MRSPKVVSAEHWQKVRDLFDKLPAAERASFERRAELSADVAANNRSRRKLAKAAYGEAGALVSAPGAENLGRPWDCRLATFSCGRSACKAHTWGAGGAHEGAHPPLPPVELGATEYSNMYDSCTTLHFNIVTSWLS